jgi:hypothetical protein
MAELRNSFFLINNKIYIFAKTIVKPLRRVGSKKQTRLTSLAKTKKGLFVNILGSLNKFSYYLMEFLTI